MKKSELAAKRRQEAVDKLKEIASLAKQIKAAQLAFNRAISSYSTITDADLFDLDLESDVDSILDEVKSWLDGEW